MKKMRTPIRPWEVATPYHASAFAPETAPSWITTTASTATARIASKSRKWRLLAGPGASPAACSARLASTHG